MKQVRIHDSELLNQLQTNPTVEVVDATGRVIARVEYKSMSCPEIGLTDEELEARLKDPNAKRYTAEEVMAHLNNRLNGDRNV